MTVGVRLSRMGRNRGRNLYAEYGAPRPYMRVGEQITSGDTSSTGQTIYAAGKLTSTIVTAIMGSGGTGGMAWDTGLAIMSDFTPLGALFGKLFGVKHHEDIYGKRYTEFQVFNSKYGIPINEGDGNVRLAGNVIWTTEPKELVMIQEQQTSDNPVTFMDYRSRTGLTKQQILDQGIQYEPTSYTFFAEYKEWHYVLSFAVAFANIKNYPGEIVRIWADKEIIWDIRDSNLNEPTQLMTVGYRDSDYHKFYKDTLITVYNGKHTDRDPTIVADKGEDTPAYKNICYAVFKNLDLKDFNGKMPIIEAEVGYRSSPVKYGEGLGLIDTLYDSTNIGWVHDTTDGYIIGSKYVPHYYDLDVYECFAFKSPKIFNNATPMTTSSTFGFSIHETKYGYICTNIGQSGEVRYIGRSANKVVEWKDISNAAAVAFPYPKDAVYNYRRNLSSIVADLAASERRVIYAYGLFGTGIVQTYPFVQEMQDFGFIIPDDDPLYTNMPELNPIVQIGYNNQAGGLNTFGDIGGLMFDRTGTWRITTDSGAFGSHGAPTYLWNTEYLAPALQGAFQYIEGVTSPLYSKQTLISNTGSAGILTLLEDSGKLAGRDNNGLLVIQSGGYLYHFNTTLTSGFEYEGITKVSTGTFDITQEVAVQMPMSGRLAGKGSGAGGLYKQINCEELEYIGQDWRSSPYGPVPLYQNPNGREMSVPPSNSVFEWIPVMDMSYTIYNTFGGDWNPYPLLCKYRWSTANPTLGEVVSEIILSKIPYITAADLDVSTLTDIVRGYMMADTSKLVEFIERLRKGYFFDVTESDGKLKCIKRGVIDTVTNIDETLLEDSVSAIVHSVADMAKEGVLNYADWDFDFLQNSQRHRRESAKSLNMIENTLPIVFNADEAARVAYIYINGSYAEAIEIQATLDRSYSYLQCSDIISIGMFNRIRIIHMTMLQDGGIQIQGVTEDSQIYNTSAIGVPVLNYKSLRRLSSARIQAFPFETTYIDHQINSAIGYVYIPAFKRFVDSSISISVAVDSGSYKYIGSTNPSKFIGRVVNRLLPTNYSTKHGTWDYDNYIDVFIQQGNAPVSATKAEVYLGANKILIGREILAFTTVEQLGTNRYKLSGLLRGRDGTELFTRLHNTSEYLFELYDSIPKVYITEELIGSTIFIRGKERNTKQALGSYIIKGLSFTPLAPTNVKATLSGNDIVITWNRRNSAQGELIPLSDIPTGNITSYSLHVLDNNMNIKRIITSTTETATYTSVQQIADFGANQISISLVAYQHTDTIRGYGEYVNIALVSNKYYTDFINSTIGIQPTDITIQSGNITALPILDTDNKKALEINTGTTLAQSSISIDPVGDMSDADIRFKFKYDTFYGYQETYLLRIFLKGTNSIVSIHSNGTIVCEQTGEMDSLAYTDSESFNYGNSITKNIIYNVRVQYYEEIIRVKIWKDIEPSAWLFSYFPEVIASQPIFALKIAGYVGIGSYTKNCKIILKDIEINDLY